MLVNRLCGVPVVLSHRDKVDTLRFSQRLVQGKTIGVKGMDTET